MSTEFGEDAYHPGGGWGGNRNNPDRGQPSVNVVGADAPNTFKAPESNFFEEAHLPQHPVPSPLRRFGGTNEALVYLQNGAWRKDPGVANLSSGISMARHPFPVVAPGGVKAPSGARVVRAQIPLKGVRAAWQDSVNVGRVLDYVKQPSAVQKPVRVVRTGDDTYAMWDGLHRATAEYMKGADTVSALVLTGDQWASMPGQYVDRTFETFPASKANA